MDEMIGSEKGRAASAKELRAQGSGRLTLRVSSQDVQEDIHELAHEGDVECRFVDTKDRAQGLKDQSENLVASLENERDEL